MILLKPINTTNGLTSAHAVTEIVAQSGTGTLKAQLTSYATLEHALANQSILWQIPIHVPLAGLALSQSADIFEAVAEYLLLNHEDLADATVAPAPGATDLETAKNAKWAEIKARRLQEERAPFVVDGVGTFDADVESRSKLTASAVVSILAPEEYAETWTLADNTDVALDADTIRQVAVTFAAKVGASYQRSRELRAIIFAEETDTIEKVQAISWDSTPEQPADPEAPEAPVQP